MKCIKFHVYFTSCQCMFDIFASVVMSAHPELAFVHELELLESLTCSFIPMASSKRY